jgi:hypothetical protein
VVLLDHEWRAARVSTGCVISTGAKVSRRSSSCRPTRSADAVEARSAGAFEVIGKAKIKHTKLNDAIRRAADEQAKAQSRWRMSAGAKMAQDFAGARLKAIGASS